MQLIIKATLLIISLFTTYLLLAQSKNLDPKAVAYIDQYKELSMIEMARTGVPAAITLAQGILESACGQSDLARRSNNHFGIKCKAEWTGGKTYHDDDAKSECFRVYNSVEESFIDHSDFLKNRPFYKDLFTLEMNDYKGWAYGLKKAGYATNKNYPQLLISLIEKYDLAKYSYETIANIDMYRYLAINRNMTKQDYHATVAKNIKKEIKEIKARTVYNATPAKTEPEEQRPAYPEGFFTINGTKVFYAEKGFSLKNFCKTRNLKYTKILSYNDMQHTDALPEGRLIYLEKRKKRGNKAIFKTKKGNTLREIALIEGIRLEQLKKYNKINADSKIAANQKVYLQKKSPSKIIVLN